MVMGDLVREVDVAVVGGGPGGYSAAFRCADLGLEAVVVDAGKRLGGACLYEGCIPSKALLHVAEVIALAQSAKEFGVDFGDPRVSLDPLRKWIAERVVGKLSKGVAFVAKKKGVDIVGGRAVFEDSRSLRVEGDEPQKIRFKHAVIATGSLPSPLPGVTARSERVMDSTAALALADVPERLLVIGGGYIGLELGQVYAALGSQVTLVEMLDGLLPGVDRDLLQPLARRSEDLFEKIHLSTEVTDLRDTGSAIEATLGSETRTFDRVLVAVGRKAQSAGLGLETTRVRSDPRGIIAVDDRCRTDDPHIYAVGDVTGEPMLAHRAMRQGKVAAEVIAGRPAAFDNVVVPAVVFTDPEVAWCGLTEEEAQRAGRAVKIAKFQWAASGRAATLGRSDGLTKLVVDPASGRVLGVGIVGPGAGELIAEGALAVEAALTAEDVALTIHTHPTLSETLMEAAESFLIEAGHR
ncbi:MAG: dihydrolipoamide dehydrogenase, dihydrolipoamide dehydrogenase [Candidatus Rokubacteria bacterium CSP1-6]|nr:MAG: dihydrolipoamide dehydrogenase, dihydrolipoamide dehydrogenase [Candidatus Rokubacteria bacterium CSP1-6]